MQYIGWAASIALLIGIGYQYIELEKTNNQVVTVEQEKNKLQEAVVDFEGKSYVFHQKSKLEFQLIPVMVGESNNGFIEILSPDLNDKKIVLKGSYSLLTAMKNSGEE